VKDSNVNHPVRCDTPCDVFLETVNIWWVELHFKHERKGSTIFAQQLQKRVKKLLKWRLINYITNYLYFNGRIPVSLRWTIPPPQFFFFHLFGKKNFRHKWHKVFTGQVSSLSPDQCRALEIIFRISCSIKTAIKSQYMIYLTYRNTIITQINWC